MFMDVGRHGRSCEYTVNNNNNNSWAVSVLVMNGVAV